MSASSAGAIHQTEIRDGVLLAGSDPHWTEQQPTSTATRALVQMAREFAAECRGFTLDEQLDPSWRPAEVLDINPGAGGLLLKHRHRGGANAARANAQAAGKSIATGHVHQPNCIRLSNAASADFWGVDLGTMADPRAGSFAYTEGAAALGMLGWSSAVWVFTFEAGRLLWPEPVHVVDEAAGLFTFRGRIHRVESVGSVRRLAA